MVSLGDILRKVANEIFIDVKNMLLAMKNQDSELRTTVMKVLILHSRKKLVLCYSMIRWLSNVNAKQNLHCIADFSQRVSCVQDCVNQKLDELFFSHAAIYSMRNNGLEVHIANDVITSSGSQLLPQSVFTCGFPSLPNIPEDPFTVFQELSLLISAKLALCGACFQQYSSVADGVLTVRVPGSFEVLLSLTHLDARAPWTVLGCRVLSANAPPRGSVHEIHTPDHSMLAARMVAIIADYIATATKTDAQSTAPSVGSLTESAGSISGCCAGSVEDDNILTGIVRMCGHAAAAASLCLFHAQAVRSASSRWAGLMQVSLDERSAGGVSTVEVLLWRSPLTREFGLRMTISHQRRRSAKETEFQCTAPTLQCRLSALQDSVARSAESCLSGVRVPAENFYLSRGVWFEGLLDAALAQSVDRKLLHLQRRLYSSLSALNDSLVTRYSLRRSGSSLVVSRQAASSAALADTFTCARQGVAIEVDVRTGRYLLSSLEAGLGAAILESRQRDVDLFLAEINNIRSEQLFCRYFSSAEGEGDGAKGSGQRLEDQSQPSPPMDEVLSTLEGLLLALELAHWDGVVRKALCVGSRCAPTAFNAQDSGSDLRACLHQLARWQLTAVTKQQHCYEYRTLVGRQLSVSTSHHKSSSDRTVGSRKRGVEEMLLGRDDGPTGGCAELFLSLRLEADLSLTMQSMLSLPLPKDSFDQQKLDIVAVVGGSWSTPSRSICSVAMLAQHCAKQAALWARDLLGDVRTVAQGRPLSVRCTDDGSGVVARFERDREGSILATMVGGTDDGVYCAFRLLPFACAGGDVGMEWLVHDLMFPGVDRSVAMRSALLDVVREALQLTVRGAGVEGVEEAVSALRQWVWALVSSVEGIRGGDQGLIGFLRPLHCFVPESGGVAAVLAVHKYHAGDSPSSGISPRAEKSGTLDFTKGNFVCGYVEVALVLSARGAAYGAVVVKDVSSDLPAAAVADGDSSASTRLAHTALSICKRT